MEQHALERPAVALPDPLLADGRLASAEAIAVRRQAEPFERRGEPVLYLAGNGGVTDLNPAAERARDRLFQLFGRRLTTVVPADQRRLEDAVAAALRHGEPALVAVTSFSGTGQVMALVLPVEGHDRDQFQAVAALVVFLEGGRETAPDERSLALLRDAAGLTGREVDVVRLIVGGATPQQVAERLGIGLGTTRLHLKAAFAKVGVHSQAELAALVGRLG